MALLRSDLISHRFCRTGVRSRTGMEDLVGLGAEVPCINYLPDKEKRPGLWWMVELGLLGPVASRPMITCGGAEARWAWALFFEAD